MLNDSPARSLPNAGQSSAVMSGVGAVGAVGDSAGELVGVASPRPAMATEAVSSHSGSGAVGSLLSVGGRQDATSVIKMPMIRVGAPRFCI
jgi:hypothetical protein